MDINLAKLNLVYAVTDEGKGRYLAVRNGGIRLYQQGDSVTPEFISVYQPFDFPLYVGIDLYQNMYFIDNNYTVLGKSKGYIAKNDIEDAVIEFLNTHSKQVLNNWNFRADKRLELIKYINKGEITGDTRNNVSVFPLWLIPSILVYDIHSGFSKISPEQSHISIGYGYYLRINNAVSVYDSQGHINTYGKTPLINELIKSHIGYKNLPLLYAYKSSSGIYIVNLLTGKSRKIDLANPEMVKIVNGYCKRHSKTAFESIYNGKVYSGIRIIQGQCSGDISVNQFTGYDSDFNAVTYTYINGQLGSKIDYWDKYTERSIFK